MVQFYEVLMIDNFDSSWHKILHVVCGFAALIELSVFQMTLVSPLTFLALPRVFAFDIRLQFISCFFF